MNRNEMLNKVRQRTAERIKNRRDPDEFRPPKVQDDQTLEFVFKVLPSLCKGDKCKTGICEQGVADEADGLIWWYENGGHFIQNDKLECPRIHQLPDECPICKEGFDLMAESDEKEYRRKIARLWLSKSYYAINIYFPDDKRNPESLRNKVMWYNMPKQVWDKMDSCLNNDDPGTEDDKKAYGVFFHPEECYLFKLVVKKQGEYNNYEESVFLPASLGPLAKKDDGSSDKAGIEAILAQRHDLRKKFKSINMAKLHEVHAKMMNKEATGGDASDGEESDAQENVENIPGVTKGVSTTTKSEPKTETKTEPKKEEKADEKTEKKTETKAEPAKTEEKAEPAKTEEKAEATENDEELDALLQSIKSKKK